MACGKAPEGCRQWTMPLLSDTLVKLKIVDEISEETVRKTLKQTSSNLGAATGTPCRSDFAILHLKRGPSVGRACRQRLEPRIERHASSLTLRTGFSGQSPAFAQEPLGRQQRDEE